MQDVFDWSKRPKLQEPIRFEVSVAGELEEITGTCWYNSKTRAGKVVLNLNASVATTNDDELSEIANRVAKEAENYLRRLAEMRNDHLRYESKIDRDQSGQMDLEDEARKLSMAAQGDEPEGEFVGTEDKAKPKRKATRKRKAKAEDSMDVKVTVG